MSFLTRRGHEGIKMLPEGTKLYDEVDPLNPQKASGKLKKIGELCDTASGGTPLSTNDIFYKNGNIPWINSSEVKNGYLYSTNRCITQEGLENSSAKIFPIDTVLVAMYGATAGQVGILKIPAATNQAVCGILPSDRIVSEFLYYYLQTQLKVFQLLRTGKV